jgi:hypothetical protein
MSSLLNYTNNLVQAAYMAIEAKKALGAMVDKEQLKQLAQADDKSLCAILLHHLQDLLQVCQEEGKAKVSVLDELDIRAQFDKCMA